MRFNTGKTLPVTILVTVMPMAKYDREIEASYRGENTLKPKQAAD
jgi:hypothetical protein